MFIQIFQIVMRLFVEYVEEVYSVEVKTPKQLEELIVTTVDWIEDVFIEAMDSKYFPEL